MSKHHNADHSAASQASSQASPNDESVIEGEVLTDPVEESIDEKIARGRAYSKAKTGASDQNAATVSSLKAASWFTKYRFYVLWLLMFITVILVLLITRPDTAWQVQHINALQSDVTQLYQDNQALETRLKSQTADLEQTIQSVVEKRVAKAVMDTENQPLVSQADLDSIKQTTQQQFIKLQERLLKLKEAVTLPLQKTTEATEVVAGSQPLQETAGTANGLEQKLQTQISEMGSKLAALFDFKARQQAASSQQPLNSLQIKQWIVAMNTQWILQGRVEQTRQQLLALEQAIALSDLPKSTTLARLIGQDLAQLETLQQASSEKIELNTEGLKQAILNLTFSEIKRPDTLNKSMNGGDQISVGQEVSSESAWDQLVGRFGQMISLKKRESSTEQTKVESLVMQDVLVQRALLLVDRIDWALQTQSTSQLNLAIAELEGFITRHFKAQESHFETLLQPYKVQQFTLRQPLAILSLPSES